VKEKTLAAYRAGLRQVVLPSGNRRDLRDVPDDVREGMTFHFVERMDQVFDLALTGDPTNQAARLPVLTEATGERQAASEA
jgi:ATP-dependent Lon protease